MRRWREGHGQASGEYVALVALVACVLALAAGLTSGGVGGRVLAGLQRGLCAVADRDCPRPLAPAPDLAPCPLERSERAETLKGTADSLRLGTGGMLTAVRTSDGRVTVTLADSRTAGAEVGIGPRLRLGERSIDASATATATATWTSGRSWTLPDAAAARRFIATYGSKATIGGKLLDRVRGDCSLLCDAIGWRPTPLLPGPDKVDEAGGATAKLAASLGSAGVERQVGAALGRSVARDGTTTWYLRIDAALTAELGLPVGGLAVGKRDQALLAYRLNGAGRPLAFEVKLTGEQSARATAGAGGVGAGAAGGRVVELDATLDLRDPANRAAAAALFGALSDPAALVRRAAALRERIALAGQVDRRVYALETTTGGVAATIALGVEVGAGLERATRGLRLLSAETRLPGLPFLPRDDCRPA